MLRAQFVSGVLIASAAGAQAPRLAYHVPAVDSVRVVAGQSYRASPSAKYDLCLPGVAGGTAPRPVVVVFNGGQGRARTSSLNVAWCRLLAGIGLAAVTFDSDSAGPAVNFDALVGELARVKTTYGLDTDRIGIWAGSGNAPAAVTVASDSARRMVRALVLYYGTGPATATTFRRDLPIQVVRAGLDQPELMHDIDAFVARALAFNAPISVINHASGEHPFEESPSRAGANVVESTLAFLYHMLAANHASDIAAESARAEAGAAAYAGDWPRASRAFQTLADATADDAELQRRLGDARLAAGEFAAAITAYLRSRELEHWRRRDIQIGLVAAYAQSGRRDKAFAELDSLPPSWDRVQLVASHPQLVPLRRDPEVARHLGVSMARLTGDMSSLIPSPRAGHVMTTAGPAGGVYLLGGQIIDNTPRLVDTLWSWMGDGWRVASTDGPTNRSLPGAAFDAKRGVLVLYGGRSIGNGTRYGDTWEWDGKRWQERVVRTPGSRDHHAMVFDEARGKVVMYGGASGERPGMPNDTWTWDGTKWEMADSVTGPGGLAHHAMAYDSKRERVVLVGGFNQANQRLADVWEWDGVRWTRVPTTGPAPSPRSHHRLAYDAARGVTVLFGGGDRTAETWTWDGRTWTPHGTSGPAGRYMQAMAYDAQRQRVVLFGGSGSGGVPPYNYLDDTWEWDGERWRRRP